MARRYASFLLRCWQVGPEWRVGVEHVQSGSTARLPSLPEALDWIERQVGRLEQTATGPPAASDQAGTRLVDTGDQRGDLRFRDKRIDGADER